jgi:hypothetical protein
MTKVYGIVVWGDDGRWWEYPRGRLRGYAQRFARWVLRRPPASVTWGADGIARLNVPER